VLELVRGVARTMQEFTQSGGVRPFGVSLLVTGWDQVEGPSLYQVDPSGTYFGWRASAVGKNQSSAKAFLEKRYAGEAGERWPEGLRGRARAEVRHPRAPASLERRRPRQRLAASPPRVAFTRPARPCPLAPAEDMDVEDAVHTAIMTLREGFEGEVTASNIEIATVEPADGTAAGGRFVVLSAGDVGDYLDEAE